MLQNGDADAPARWRLPMVACLCLVAVAFGLRFYDLDGADLTEDEELSNELPALSFPALFTDIAGRPPLPFVAQKIVMTVTGSAGPIDIRLASVIEGAAGVLALFLFAWRLRGYRLALIAAALLTCSHFHITWSRDGRYYPLFMLVSVLFMWCYWEVFHNQRWAVLVPLAILAYALPMAHQAGVLLLGGCVAALPIFLLSASWRAWIRRHPGLVVAAFIAGVVCGGMAAPLLKGYLRPAFALIAHSSADTPLPPFFDVSPEFLLNRLAEVMAFPRPYVFLILLALVFGFLHAVRHRPLFFVLAEAILIFPFAALWHFRPEHFWHPKYFIFMLPVLLVMLAWCFLGLSGLVARCVSARAAPWLKAGVEGVLVLAFCVPNLWATAMDYRHPRTDFQHMGAFLSESVRPGDQIRYTWEEPWRVVRNYYDLPIGPESIALIDSEAGEPWRLADAPQTWYLHSGKAAIPHATSALMLSDWLSRVPCHYTFLGFGPNLQRIEFGANYPGHPVPNGPLTLAPRGQGRVEVMFSRPGRRAVLVSAAPADVPLSLSVALPRRPPVTLECRAGECTGVFEVPFGRATLIFANHADDVTATLEFIEIVPLLTDALLEIPAWDFYALEGTELLGSVWTERIRGRTLLRDMRAGHTAYYRFFCARAGAAAIRVSALNDAPGANRYAVRVPGAANEPCRLSFDLENGRVSSQETPRLMLRRGVYTVCVQYLGLPEVELRARTHDFKVMTEERLQTSGLERIAIVPLPNG